MGGGCRGRARTVSTCAAVALGAAALALSLAGGAYAHNGGTTGLATVTVSDQTVRYALELPAAAIPGSLADRMRLGQPGLAPDSTPLRELVARHIRLANLGEPCEAAVGFATTPPDAVTFAVGVDFACAVPVSRLTIRDDMFDVLGGDYHALAKIQWPGGVEQFVFQPDQRETTVDIASRPSSSIGGEGFLRLGIGHILGGYDHLLFLLVLVLRGGSLWSLFKIVTAFTVAHSLTLALAALDVVVLPPRLVEAGIALSIAYAAADNLFLQRPTSRRWVVAFVFGLLHGFGFSAVLHELALPREGLVWALLSFNLGVEAGQAFAVLLVLPLLVWLRRYRWEPRAAAAISAAVLVIGVVLFVDRAFLMEPSAQQPRNRTTALPSAAGQARAPALAGARAGASYRMPVTTGRLMSARISSAVSARL